MAYMSLKWPFKQQLLTNANLLSQLINAADKSQFQSIVFLLLNLVRDAGFDQLPSHSLADHDQSKQMDISYFELKEL
jgi:hypothetical protein